MGDEVPVVEDKATIAALQAKLAAVEAKKGDRPTGKFAGYAFSLLAAVLALCVSLERRADGFYPRQEVSPLLIPLLVLAGTGLGVPISAGAVGEAIDKVVSK